MLKTSLIVISKMVEIKTINPNSTFSLLLIVMSIKIVVNSNSSFLSIKKDLTIFEFKFILVLGEF